MDEPTKKGTHTNSFYRAWVFSGSTLFCRFLQASFAQCWNVFSWTCFFLNRTLTQISAFQGRKTVTFLLFIDNWMSVCSFDLWNFLVFLCLFLQDIFCTSNCADLNLLPPIWEPIFHHWLKNTQIGFDKTVKVSANENCCACLDFHRVEFE